MSDGFAFGKDVWHMAFERGVGIRKWLDALLSTWQSRNESPVIPGRNNQCSAL